MNDIPDELHRLKSDESWVEGNFLDNRSEESFAALFRVYSPQLKSFFRSRNCDPSLTDDLTQDVMLTVYLKASQIRERKLFRSWVFSVARNSFCRYCEQRSREIRTLNLDDLSDESVLPQSRHSDTLVSEFMSYVSSLEPLERETMRLRFVEEWEYHEIALAQAIPVGTVQWRVFNSKKKLTAHFVDRHARGCRQTALPATRLNAKAGACTVRRTSLLRHES